MDKPSSESPATSESAAEDNESAANSEGDASNQWSAERPAEYGGRRGLDPVRYGDWEKNGRCIDF
ncbi:DUF1674 domain-containing protein [Salinisphaera sp. USBA-960]|uniref:DUF1674 domain-containing protein n=1 Tax=Salinisphaera orenii TaxID=856731 RepID=UPI000DBE267C|nr:DUF1674 domain-containing protein [Salifodinibacter halophilus]NNC26067.1 DUF1674 domain-containing protein [Salifodinibacter halophilus]